MTKIIKNAFGTKPLTNLFYEKSNVHITSGVTGEVPGCARPKGPEHITSWWDPKHFSLFLKEYQNEEKSIVEG